MTGPIRFTIGSEVSCHDGPCGKLRRVVVDPVARTLTHLVVEPEHDGARGHLVPIALVSSTTSGVVLACTRPEFDNLEDAEEAQFVPGGRGQWGYSQDQMLSWPYYGLGAVGAFGLGGMGRTGMNSGTGTPQVITNDRVPVGEVEVRRGEHVFATDGAIGRVQGLVVHPGDHCVTHVLLDEGHLWGQKRVAVPISAVTEATDGVRLNLSKDEVRDLPPVEVDLQE
jgi:hypothetical protein